MKVVLLSPNSDPSGFARSSHDPTLHRSLFDAAARLRAKVYLEDGAIRSCDIDHAGRFLTPTDASAWHAVAIDDQGNAIACVRTAGFMLSEIQSDIPHVDDYARRLGDVGVRYRAEVIKFLERLHALWGAARPFYHVTGGLAVHPSHTMSSAMLRVSLASRIIWRKTGAVGTVGVATTRHDSIGLLRRIGSQILAPHGEPETFFDPFHDCKIAFMGSAVYSEEAKFRKIADRLERELDDEPVLTKEPIQC